MNHINWLLGSRCSSMFYCGPLCFRTKMYIVQVEDHCHGPINEMHLHRSFQQYDQSVRGKYLLFGCSSVSTPSFPRRAPLYPVGAPGLLLCHPDRAVRPQPLQQEPDGAPAPRRGVWHSGGGGRAAPGQPGIRRRPLERGQGLQPEPRARQGARHRRQTVQRPWWASFPSTHLSRSLWQAGAYLLQTAHSSWGWLGGADTPPHQSVTICCWGRDGSALYFYQHISRRWWGVCFFLFFIQSDKKTTLKKEPLS